MYKIKIELSAIEDMVNIFAYYDEVASLQVAEKNEDRIYQAIFSLETMPNRCRNSEYYNGAKELIVSKLPYKVYFHIDENTKTVSILNIIHSSRNLEKLFED